MKVNKILTKDAFSNIGKIRHNKKITKKSLPIVAIPIVAMTLRTQKDTVDYMGEQLLKGHSPNKKMVDNLTILDKLESKGVINNEQPWDAPRFNDSILTQTTYKLRLQINLLPQKKNNI